MLSSKCQEINESTTLVENDEDGYADAKRGNKRGNSVCAYWTIFISSVSYGINMKDTLPPIVLSSCVIAHLKRP